MEQVNPKKLHKTELAWLGNSTSKCYCSLWCIMAALTEPSQMLFQPAQEVPKI